MIPPRMRRLLAGALIALGLAAPLRAAEAPLVAAAATLQFAMEEITDAWRAAGGGEVRLAYGSSGNFARQIREGAPFELFLAADEDFVLDLARDGFAEGESVVYAVGRLALMVPRGSPLKADAALDDLAAGLADRRVTRLAIASPEHAPYGMRAREALRHRGLWDAVQPALVMGENVAQAAQFAASGNAQGGIIAYSLAVSPQLMARGTHALIPGDWHLPLRQRMTLLEGAGPEARAFFAFMQGEAVGAILRRNGFARPGD